MNTETTTMTTAPEQAAPITLAEAIARHNAKHTPCLVDVTVLAHQAFALPSERSCTYSDARTHLLAEHGKGTPTTDEQWETYYEATDAFHKAESAKREWFIDMARILRG